MGYGLVRFLVPRGNVTIHTGKMISLRHHQGSASRLMTAEWLTVKGSSRKGFSEKANRKISSRGLRSRINSAIAALACGILGSMLPEVSTSIPPDTGVLRSLRKNSMGRCSPS